MSFLSYTLVTDGPSDQVLRHPIDWVLTQVTARDFSGEWADPGVLQPTSRRLTERLPAVLSRYPCDLLFVHRDAEGEPRKNRVQEIEEALAETAVCPPAVCVVPVRMTEAWLLIDELAIRKAADNPRGSADLAVPKHGRLEAVPDPKLVLREAILKASDSRTRRRRKLSKELGWRQHRVAEYIEDWSVLRALPAFRAFEDEVRTIVAKQGWA